MSRISTDQLPAEIPSAALPFKPLSRHDVAAILGVSVRTVENWRKEKRIPQSVEIGGRVYWHPESFYAGLNAKLRGIAEGDGECTSPMTTPARSANRAPAATGALEKARKRSADAIAAMSNK